MKIYIARCVDAEGETIEITNDNYHALMDGIDRYGFDVVDVYELDHDYWSTSKDFDNLSKEDYDTLLEPYKTRG